MRPLPVVAGSADVDGLTVLTPDRFYVSFTSTVTVPGVGSVPDEDIVEYDTWCLEPVLRCHRCRFGWRGRSGCVHVDGTDVYFSTISNTALSGVPGTPDSADIYLWDGATFSRVFDASAAGLAGGTNVNGLTRVGPDRFYLSFWNSSTAVPGVGTVQDEDVVEYEHRCLEPVLRWHQRRPHLRWPRPRRHQYHVRTLRRQRTWICAFLPQIG